MKKWVANSKPIPFKKKTGWEILDPKQRQRVVLNVRLDDAESLPELAERLERFVATLRMNSASGYRLVHAPVDRVRILADRPAGVSPNAD